MGRVGERGAGALEDCCEISLALGGENGEVIVFDEDGVREREAVVVAAAAADGVALEEAERRCGFAGVDDAGVGAGGLFYKLRGEGGDTREALDEVEGDALGLEDGAGRALGVCESGVGGERLGRRCG